MDSEKKRELIERLEALADFANGGDGVTIGDATQTCYDAIAVIRSASPATQADLVEALRPFANAISMYKGFGEHQLILLSEDNPPGRRLAHLRLDDFDRAEVALTKAGVK